MHEKLKRISALAVGAVMAATSVGMGAWASLSADAVTTNLPKTLVTSISEVQGDDVVSTNEADCSFIIAEKTDANTASTDTNSSPADYLGLETNDDLTADVDYLSFTFKATQDDIDAGYVVSRFVFYFGISATETPYDWWYDISEMKESDLKEGWAFNSNAAGKDQGSIEVHPCATEFTIVVPVPKEAKFGYDEYSNSKIEIQNCYTQLVKEGGETASESGSIQLTDVSVATSRDRDTSEADEETKDKYAAQGDGPSAPQNTGGLWYTSALYQEYNEDVYALSSNPLGTNADGAQTLTSTKTLRLDLQDDPITLTQGDNYSETYYGTEAGGGYTSEDDIRAAGLPLNSHKFDFVDFGLTLDNSITVKSLSVTLQIDPGDSTSVTRLMYGGGISVDPKSVADTEWYKAQTDGKISTSAKVEDGGYWYNDVGSADYQIAQSLINGGYKATDADGNTVNGVFAIDVESGTNLKFMKMSNYLTVTWDVPEEVQAHELKASNASVSFQLWYMEVDGELTDATANIVSAAVTYEQSTLLSTNDTLAHKTVNVKETGTIGSETPVEVPYADLLAKGTDYENIADIYAVQVDFSLNSDVNNAQVDFGTSVLESLDSSYWYQASEHQSPGQYYVYNFEDTTKTERDAQSGETKYDTSTYKEAYKANGKTSYTFTYVPGADLQQRISTEQDDDHLSFAVYYADLNGDVATSYTVSSVTIYYLADDEANGYKANLIEGDLTADPSEVTLHVTSTQGTADLGTSETVTLSLPVVSVESSMSRAVTAVLSTDGTTLTIDAANGSGTADGRLVNVTVTTAKGQTLIIPVTVILDEEAQTTTTTTTTTTAKPTTTTTTTRATTTTTTTRATTTTTRETVTTATTAENFVIMYGDVNLDGIVSLADVVLLAQYHSNLAQLESHQLVNANVNEDAVQGDDNDATILLRYETGNIESLPYTGE